MAEQAIIEAACSLGVVLPPLLLMLAVLEVGAPLPILVGCGELRVAFATLVRYSGGFPTLSGWLALEGVAGFPGSGWLKSRSGFAWLACKVAGPLGPFVAARLGPGTAAAPALLFAAYLPFLAVRAFAPSADGQLPIFPHYPETPAGAGFWPSLLLLGRPLLRAFVVLGWPPAVAATRPHWFIRLWLPILVV